MTETTTRRAPGKLFITGEYAVMQPGAPAILIAVDKQVSVTINAADGGGVTVSSDLHPQPVRLHWDGVRLADAPGFAHAIAALEVVAELLAARGCPAPAVDLAISSQLHDGGTKFGLGSSGAVTVAVIDAALVHCGVTLCRDERYRLAMIASARLDAAASGADLAASTWRGWVAYQAPDRVAVLDLVAGRGIEEALRTPWPHLAVRRLTAPPELTLAVGWTGSPAVTRDLVARPDPTWRATSAHRTFVAQMAESVHATVAAFDAGDPRAVLQQIDAAHRLLAGLDRAVGLGIFTAELTALCDTAQALGWVAKPSGAGGGDCGIALRDNADDPDIERLEAQWARVGVQHLPIGVLGDETDLP